MQFSFDLARHNLPVGGHTEADPSRPSRCLTGFYTDRGVPAPYRLMASGLHSQPGSGLLGALIPDGHTAVLSTASMRRSPPRRVLLPAAPRSAAGTPSGASGATSAQAMGRRLRAAGQPGDRRREAAQLMARRGLSTRQRPHLVNACSLGAATDAVATSPVSAADHFKPPLRGCEGSRKVDSISCGTAQRAIRFFEWTQNQWKLRSSSANWS